MKRFMCYWGGGYPEGVKLHDSTWFIEDRGYTPSDIENVMNLTIGESTMMDNGDHIVTCIDE